ncbi:MAG: sirohydrochlorin chelatase [Nitrospirae bacterium]|nr:sirohydrochlorin chelatase [Nitrospirota bacterium]
MSKTVILLIGHGSRNPAGNDEFLDFAGRMRARHPDETFVTCFIEFHDVLVGDGVDQAVALGATRIIAVPVILLAAGHVKMEIPEILEAGRHRHPGVEIVYARNIGVCAQTVAMLVERVAEVAFGRPDTDTGVLVLGRGSSDPDASGDVAKVARLFRQASGYDLVHYAFVGVTTPDLPTGVRQLIAMGARRVIIAPYFLFTGVLIERIHRMADDFRVRWPEVPFAVSRYFEFHDLLMDVVAERIRQATGGGMMMACDNCEYRIQATGHGHHDDPDDHHDAPGDHAHGGHHGHGHARPGHHH